MGPALLPPPHPPCPTPKPSVRLLSSKQSDENIVNALTGVVWFFLVLFHIMCNVVALTFYATIYEDLCCTCNKYIEKAHIRTVRFMVLCVCRGRGGGWGS